MPTSMGSSRARSTNTPKRIAVDARDEELRCGRCGAQYRRRGFQVVALPAFETFDRTECAATAQWIGYGRTPSRHRDLANLEGVTAELFVARVALEKERRAHIELQRRCASLEEKFAAEQARRDDPVSVARHGRVAASGGRS